ncbi:2282_t:CDS:2, partial [Funneliformis geosporum]
MVKELPRELWLEVFKHFIVNFGFAELYKYREVCKVWYELIIVIVMEKLMSMLTRIKYYYRILKGSSEMEEEVITTNASTSSENTNDTISYNYKMESFEYHFITALKYEQDKEEIFKQQECYRICVTSVANRMLQVIGGPDVWGALEEPSPQPTRLIKIFEKDKKKRINYLLFVFQKITPTLSK